VGERFEIAGVSLEHRFGRTTYVALSADWLRSKVNREIGAFVLGDGPLDTFSLANTPQRLDYTEESVALNAHQLLGTRGALNAGYRISRAELDQDFPAIPPTASVDPLIAAHSQVEGVLHRFDLGVSYNHPAGFFGTAEMHWWHQSNLQDAAALADEDMWQANVYAGWRLWQRKAEVTIGVLNLTDQDYHLNPINYIIEPPRSRTLFMRFRMNL